MVPRVVAAPEDSPSRGSDIDIRGMEARSIFENNNMKNGFEDVRKSIPTKFRVKLLDIRSKQILDNAHIFVCLSPSGEDAHE